MKKADGHEIRFAPSRQCYAWSMPYGISFADGEDVKNGKIAGKKFEERLEMFARDVRIYGEIIAKQRRADLKGPGSGAASGGGLSA